MGIDLGRKEDVKEILERLGIEKETKKPRAKKSKKSVINHSQKIKPEYDYTQYSADIKNYDMFPYAWNVQLLREEHNNGAWPNQPLFTKDDGSKIVRPLSLKETIEAKINDYNLLTLPDGRKRDIYSRFRLFSTWLNSCTGIAHKSGSTKFKIIPICREMVLIDEGFCELFMPIDYDSMEGIELDSTAGKYGEHLTEKEVLEHPAWRAVVEDDISLLREYTKLVFSKNKEYKHRMKISLKKGDNSESDELWPTTLSALYLVSDLRSDIVSTYGFTGGSCFLKIEGKRRMKQ